MITSCSETMKSFKAFWTYLLIVTDFSGNVITESNSCSKYQSECETGNQCIAFNEFCNGVADCDDLSDETVLACRDVRCPPNTYRCSYGACVNGDSVCNGIQNCIDNSDETTFKCSSALETSKLKESCLGIMLSVKMELTSLATGSSNLSANAPTNAPTARTSFRQITETSPPTTETSPPKAYSPLTKTSLLMTKMPPSITKTSSPIAETSLPNANMASPITETSSPITETSSPITETSSPQTRAYSLPTLRTETSSLPTETSSLPTETSSLPTKTSSLPTETSSLSTETSLLMIETPPPIIATSPPFIATSPPITETHPCTTQTSLPILNESCLIPADLADTIRIYYESTNDEIIKGTYATPYSKVIYICESKYILDGDAQNFCDNGKWVLNHPKCISFCPPLSGITTTAKCEFDGETVSCFQPLRPNTTARVKCALGYKKPEDRILTDVLHCDDDGRWDYLPYTCEQICGVEAPEDVSLIIGGAPANITKVPWHVGIYYKIQDKFINVCGGTILNAKIVVGSASGFFNFTGNTYVDPSIIRVVAGKYYQDFYANEPLQPQVLNISQIIYERKFSKSLFEVYEANVVLLVLDDYIKFNSYIKPICLETETHEKVIESGLNGRLAGWGATSPGIRTNSPTLKIIDLPTVDINKCKQVLSSETALFLSADKFCAGYTNGQSICNNDLGGGLVFPKTINGTVYNFLKGYATVVDVKFRKCDNFKYSVFTNVQYHIEMINFYLNKTKEGTIACEDKYADNYKICVANQINEFVRKGTCLIPQDISDDVLIYEDVAPYFGIYKEDLVRPFIGIVFYCKQNYTLIGNSTNFCNNGEWTDSSKPKCVLQCPPLPLSGIAITSKCEIDGRTVSCIESIQPNTVAKISCAFGYQKPSDRIVIDELHCNDKGEWNFPELILQFKCEQVCGLQESHSLIAGSDLTNVTKAPWHVGIYSNILEKDHFIQICGGTILNAKVVISAAHCFWDSSVNKFFDPSNFKVAAGKYYRDLHATEQFSPQIINVAQINYKSEYNDNPGHYGFDIAVLVLVDYIEFKPYIRPICVEAGMTSNEKNIELGLIARLAGWGIVSSDGKRSPELKMIDLPAIEYNECKKKVSTDLRPFITSDKFCTYTNRKSVCRSDSGSGLVFLKGIGENRAYFLKGVLGTAGGELGSCSNNKYTLFTNIQHHIEMITFYESQNRPK